MKYTIICAVSDETVFSDNLGSSDEFMDHEKIIKRGYTNICKAYNEAIKEATGDYLIFVHQDVYLPDGFFRSLSQQITILENSSNWGICGPAGRKGNAEYAGHIMDRGKPWGSKIDIPVPVMTLDELCLIAKKQIFDDISFDELIPNQHLFGSDICMQALDKGYHNFAVDAFCYHNSKQGFDLPPEFWKVAGYLKNKWAEDLPIFATCAIIGQDEC